MYLPQGSIFPRASVYSPQESVPRFLICRITVFTDATVTDSMAVPKPTSALEVGAVIVGAFVALIVVLPLVPVILDFVVGIFRGFFDVIVPGGRTYSD